jgi:hypothetical protein
VGFFFEAMYRTGPYWIFIGLVQVVGAIAVVIPQTALVGAILLLPVVVSILLITWGIGFAGTVWIAAGMLLSVTYLLCWDADRVWRATAVVVGASSALPIRGRVHALERVGWWLGGASGLALLLVARGLLPRTLTRELFYAGVVAFALIVSGWILTLVAPKRSQPRVR